MHSFGKDIAYRLYTSEDGVELPKLPSQTITAYVFRDQPSREDAIAGTNAIQTISYSHTPDQGGTIQFPIPAISDPDPNIMSQVYYFWVAVKYVLTAGAQVQTILKVMPMCRAVAHDTTIGVTAESIQGSFPTVYQYLSEDAVRVIISKAKNELLADLKNKGFEWAKINRPDQLQNALEFRSLSRVYASQIKGNGDRFAILYEIAKSSYDATINNLQLSYDENLQGATTDIVRPSGVIRVMR